MPNTYVNKVQKADGTTILDISDTTAVASDVASGKYFYLATGQKVQGTSTSGGYITQDADGYVVLSSTNGVPTLINKTITESGTYNPASDGATGYSVVTVDISGGGANIDDIGLGNLPSYSKSISFSNQLLGEPLAFTLVDNTLQREPVSYNYASWYYVMAVVYNGTSTKGMYWGDDGKIHSNASGYTRTYSNGTLTITAPSGNYGYFNTNTNYRLTYVY